jgi:hypothetical protein
MYQELKKVLEEGGIGMEDVVYKELVESGTSGDTYDIVTWEDIYDELTCQAEKLGINPASVPPQVLNQAIFAAVANAGKKIDGFEDGHPLADDVCQQIARVAIWQAARGCNIPIESDHIEENVRLASDLDPAAEAIVHEEDLVWVRVKGESLKAALVAACIPDDKETAPALDSFALLHNPNLTAQIYDEAQRLLNEEGEDEIARLAIEYAIKFVVQQNTKVE